MLVNLSMKKQDRLVKYNSFKPIVIETNIAHITFNKDSIQVHDVNFHIPTLEKEVRNLSKKERKDYKKICQSFLATTSSLLIFPLRSMATELPVNGQIGVTNLPSTAGGMPPELMDLLLTLLKMSVATGVILGIILLVANAIGRMFRIKGMTQWASDIIKALIQILIAPALVFLVYFVATLLFGNSTWFVNPF